MKAVRLALGTAQFGLDYGIANTNGQVTPDQISAILKSAVENGVKTIDTAIAYGDAENRLGKCNLSDLSVVTKLPPYDRRKSPADWVKGHLTESKTRLGVVPDTVLLHRSLDLIEPFGDGIANALDQAYQEGMINGVGISVYSPAELDLVAERLKWTDVQLPLNVCDRRMERSGWLARLADQGVRIHARSPFLQGLLLTEAGQLPTPFDKWRSIWMRWHRWLFEEELTALTACLGFVLAFPEVYRVVVGVDSIEQWETLLSAYPETPHNIPAWMNINDPRLIDPRQWGSL